jgi:predicted site-specific integrase-resolvase
MNPVSPKQFAEHFKVSRRTVSRWNKSGAIRPILPVKPIRYDLDQIQIKPERKAFIF